MALDAQYMEVLNSKVLVVQTAFIGDAILTLPMIQYLKKSDPGKVIHVLSAPASAEIFESSPFVDKTLVYDKRGADKSLISLFRLAKKLKAEQYDAIYSPHRSMRTALLVLFSDVKNTFGFSNSSLPYAYRNIIGYSGSVHEVHRNLNLAGCSGEKDSWKILPEIKVPEDTSTRIKEFLPEQKLYAAVAPGSVWETKKYPLESYIEITDFLISGGYTVLIIGGKSDAEYCSKLSGSFSTGEVINTAGKFSIVETIELLRYCKILICNDSAPTHFGMCADIPVLTIYCSTVPGFGFYPYNEKSRSISIDNLECKPCGIHGHKACPIGTFECAHKLESGEIKKIISRMLLQ